MNEIKLYILTSTCVLFMAVYLPIVDKPLLQRDSYCYRALTTRMAGSRKQFSSDTLPFPQIGPTMNPARLLFTVALLSTIGVTQAMADCQIADAKLEEAILQKPELRGPANRQTVRDLRSLRDAAITLWSYGRHDDCERLLANIRELVCRPPDEHLGRQ